MARMPAAEWVGEQSPRTPMTRYDVYCVHTIVGYAPAHAAHFSTKANGAILQSRDTAYRSAANLNGNHRVIACENEDHGDAYGPWSGSNVPPLTDAQVIANGRILAWCNDEHGIPLQLCPNSRPESRGLAYHRQGIDGNFPARFPGRVSGGEVWTEWVGKACPGDRRIAQLPDILDIAVTLKRGGSIPDLEDDMQLSDKLGKDPKAPTVGEVLRDLHRFAGNSATREQETLRVVRSLSAAPDEIAAAVTKAIMDDLGVGSGIEPVSLRRIVYSEAARALNNRLGSLDNPEK